MGIKKLSPSGDRSQYGADGRDRTGDLMLTMHALYLLSYDGRSVTLPILAWNEIDVKEDFATSLKFVYKKG